MAIDGPEATDMAYLGGVAAATMCKRVALGEHAECEELWLNLQAQDGGRALVAGLANIAVQAVTDLLAVEAERRAATGQPGDPPSVIDTFDAISARYRMAHEGHREINRIIKGGN